MKDPERQFLAAQELLDQIEQQEWPALSNQRRKSPQDLELQQQVVDLQYIVGSLSLIRTYAVSELIEHRMFSYADVAKLTGERPKAKRDGSPDVDAEGRPIMVPQLSRQRIHQIHKGGRAGAGVDSLVGAGR